MVSRGRLLLAMALLLAGAVLSGLLLLQHHGESGGVAAVEALCGDATTSGCDEVNRSAYAEVAGVPLAAAGVAFYLSLALLLAIGLAAGGPTASPAAGLAFAAVVLALGVDVVLLGIQAFVLHAYCTLCLATYGLGAATLVTLAPGRRSLVSPGRPLESLRGAAGDPVGRAALAGWALASLAVAGGVVATENALDAREAQRVGLLLGDPRGLAAEAAPTPEAEGTPPGSPAPAGPADVARLQEQVRQAQDQARRLQETLDDPQKLQKYFDDKAEREFDQAVPQQVDLEGTPVKGPGAAPIRVLEYSDLLCPYCRSLAGAFANYLPQTGSRIALYFKHYPLDRTCNQGLQRTVHEGACWLALGGICAEQQGRFWPYHDKVFGTNLRSPGRDDVLRMAAEAGLDETALEGCLGASKTKERLAADIAEARRVGVTATPTLLVNGKLVPRPGDFLLAVEKESKRLGLAPPPAPRGQGH